MSKRCYSLPVSPWDGIGPHMRAGLAQTYIGGPFVIRTNPIGALFDAVRRFCSPVPMEEVGEGEFAAGDLSTSTPFDAATGPASDDWFAGGAFVPTAPSANGSCGYGTIWDAGLSACVSAGQGGPQIDPASIAAANAARRALATATAARDCEGVRQVLDTARTYRGDPRRQKSPQWLRWQPIAIAAKSWLERNTRNCGRV